MVHGVRLPNSVHGAWKHHLIILSAVTTDYGILDMSRQLGLSSEPVKFLCFNRCFFLNLHLSLWGFGVNTCLKLAVLRNSSDSACSLCWVHDPTLMEQCFLHDCPWSCWVLKDGAPGCFFNEDKSCKSSKCFVAGAEQLL